MNQTQTLSLVRDFLATRHQMVLATTGEHLWAVTLYFAYDENLSFYFLSDPETLHCQQLKKNPQVAIAVADSPQNPAEKKKGLQLAGLAEQLTEPNDISRALELWRGTLKVTSDDYTYEGMVNKKIRGRMYRITPTIIKFFNQELWKEGEEPVIRL